MIWNSTTKVGFAQTKDSNYTFTVAVYDPPGNTMFRDEETDQLIFNMTEFKNNVFVLIKEGSKIKASEYDLDKLQVYYSNDYFLKSFLVFIFIVIILSVLEIMKRK